MNPFTLVFFAANALGVMLLPRRLAPLPLLVCCCYMTTSQGIEIASFSFPVYRMILATGVVRVLVRRESIAGGLNLLDKLVLAWGFWIVFASFFHEWIPGSGPVFASGLVFNVTVVYFLIRVWCDDLSKTTGVIRMVAWLLVPVALTMIAEHIFQKNAFSVFGSIQEAVPIRNGRIRAQGPFAHPILAGVTGAVCVPLMIGIWKQHRASAMVGMMACLTIILACTSSTPIMTLMLGVGAVIMWRYRRWLGAARWSVVGLYVLAELFMSRPAYFLLSKIDFTGSSTGWYRSRLIQSAFEHIREWWKFGTDNTGAWMYPNIDDRHSDITNYYLYVGVIGGLLAMLLLISILWRAFVLVGRNINADVTPNEQQRFMIWCLGSGLFAHAGSSISVAYFDQSVVFFWLNVGAIGAATAGITAQNVIRGIPGRAPAGGNGKREARIAGTAIAARRYGRLAQGRNPRSLR